MGKEKVKRRGVNEEIEMEDRNRYFRDLMGGVDGKVVLGERRGMREDREEEISKEELRAVLRILKDGKAMGVDGIPKEV